MPENTEALANGGAGGAAGAAQSGGEPPKTPETPKPITFKSQEELDALIEARLARAKPKDYEELVALKQRVDAAAEQEKTDLQKAKDAQKAAETKAEQAVARANQTLVRAAIIAEAAAQNAADTDVVAALLAGTDSITVEDDGSVKGAKQAVKKLLEDKPFLVKASAPAASSGQFGGNDGKTIQQQIQEAEAKGDWGTARRLKLAQAFAPGTKA